MGYKGARAHLDAQAQGRGDAAHGAEAAVEQVPAREVQRIWVKQGEGSRRRQGVDVQVAQLNDHVQHAQVEKVVHQDGAERVPSPCQGDDSGG